MISLHLAWALHPLCTSPLLLGRCPGSSRMRCPGAFSTAPCLLQTFLDMSQPLPWFCASDFLFSCHIEVQARMSLFDFSRYSPCKVLIPKFKTKTNVPRYIQLAWFHRHTMHSSSCIHSTDVNWPPQILTGICCGRLGYIKEHHQPDFLPSVEVICGRDVMLWQPCSSCYEFIPVILKLNHSDVIGSHSYETTVFFLLRHHTTQDLAIFLFYWH